MLAGVVKGMVMLTELFVLIPLPDWKVTLLVTLLVVNPLARGMALPPT